MGRTLVLGDIHGALRALLQVLERAHFEPASDRLIALGDVCDGWPDTRGCIDLLLTVPDLVFLLGNHDEWFLQALNGRHPGYVWTTQGGAATVASYGGLQNVPEAHRAFLSRARLWFEDDGRIFVHGGWPWYMAEHPMAAAGDITWDRELWQTAVQFASIGKPSLTKFREVYVGHTTTTRLGDTRPVQRCEVWNLDQGAGWEGRLSLMDVDTKEFWQSDVVADMYPEVEGRGGRRAA